MAKKRSKAWRAARARRKNLQRAMDDARRHPYAPGTQERLRKLQDEFHHRKE